MALRLSTGMRNALLDKATGDSLANLLDGGIIKVYTGTQPATADLAATGTLLCVISVASGAVADSNKPNGLVFGAAVAGVLPHHGSDVWSGLNLATGTAGWARFVANDAITTADAASSTDVRLDMAAATSGAQINFSTTALVTGMTTTVSSCAITQPAA